MFGLIKENIVNILGSDISMIAAMSSPGRVIGRDNDLPWRIRSDMRRFKEITMGHPVIMGRKNWESISEDWRPLSGRTNIVVTRQRGYVANGAIVVHSVIEAYDVAKEQDGADEIFVIGGEDIYTQYLPFASKLYLTTVHVNIEGDTRFPIINEAQWRRVSEIPICERDPKDQYTTSFHIYERV